MGGRASSGGGAEDADAGQRSRHGWEALGESNLGGLHGLFGADSRSIGGSIECRGRMPRDDIDLNLDGHLSSTRFVDLLTPHARVAELGQLSRL